ncbi:MAG: bifunctional folylpolyglutamate synthase/dihydrofolate synthase [Clostridium sp.]|jgi:dihydrofolate synthase/folylpolyglutamate synthase|nr:bifunctional folylpolyglutamate synthase/dihydrofolate synthase [Clostridium sp.]
MNEGEAIEYLHSLQAFGVRPGLERMAALCSLIAQPQLKTSFVHVAGTNGKGSTCAMLESALRSAGYKTGLFISPYVYDFCERIQLNGKPVGGEQLAQAVARVRAAIKKMPAEFLPVTEFEALTAAAFLVFADAACDVVVLETGLGGRLDSTNIIPRPICAAITKIALDHTAILGGSLARIAAEKCGILKGGTAVIYPEQEPEALDEIRKRAGESGTRLIIPGADEFRELDADCYGTSAEICGLEMKIPLPGAHMLRNAAVAVRTLLALREGGLAIPDEAIVRGIERTAIPARMERRVLCGVPALIDGGHNPDCAAALAALLKRHFAAWHIEAVCGMMGDKDSGGYLECLAPLIAHMAAISLPPPRGASAQELAAAARARGIDCTAEESPAAALKAAQGRLSGRERALLLVCGSFVTAQSVVAAAKEINQGG